MAARLKLAEGEVLRGCFRPNNYGPVSPYPDGIEQFPSIEAAEDALNSRATGRSSDAYYVGQPAQWSDWLEADRTCYLDVWIEKPDPDENPDDVMPPDCYDQRWYPHMRGVRRENF